MPWCGIVHHMETEPQTALWKAQAEAMGLTGYEKKRFISDQYKIWRDTDAGQETIARRNAAASSHADASADEIAVLRAKVAAKLRRLGFRCFRRARKSSASTYYRRNNVVIRLSDHPLPMTADREWKYADAGEPSWIEILLCSIRRDGTRSLANIDDLIGQVTRSIDDA